MSCRRCRLHRFRRQEVAGRGDLPADILFIGEAPGRSEDLRGKPFIGPSGRILQAAIEAATVIADLGSAPRYYIANVVRCIPLTKTGGDIRPPSEDEIEACWPNLEEIYLRAKPKHVVFLGRVPETACKKRIPGGRYMYHPAFILRSGGERSSQFREFVRELSELFIDAKRRKSVWRKPKRTKGRESTG